MFVGSVVMSIIVERALEMDIWCLGDMNGINQRKVGWN